MLKGLILIIGIFLVMLFESFFLRVFSFSIFVILVISLYKRVGDIWFYLFVALVGIGLDTVLHMPLGLHMVILGVLLIMLEISWLLIPRSSNSGYIPIYFFVISYYLLLPISTSLIQNSMFPEILGSTILWILVKGLISVIFCILIDRVFVSLRDSSGGTSIRLS